MARPTWSALSAEPLSETSPLLASTSIIAVATLSSDCSLPFTMFSRTESSVEPVGAPTALSFVRTIATPRSRSAWISAGESRHSVIRTVTSPAAAPVVAEAMSLELRLVSVEPLVVLLLGLVVLAEELGLVLESALAMLPEAEPPVAVSDALPVDPVEPVEPVWPLLRVVSEAYGELELPDDVVPDAEPLVEPVAPVLPLWPLVLPVVSLAYVEPLPVLPAAPVWLVLDGSDEVEPLVLGVVVEP